jgi:hypothetical protein
MDLKEMIDKLGIKTETTNQEPEKTFEELGTEYPFKPDVDKDGLRVEHPDYVKRSCKDCLGRGGIIITPAKSSGRRWVACGCVKRGYQRAHFAHLLQIARVKAAAERAFKVIDPNGTPIQFPPDADE